MSGVPLAFSLQPLDVPLAHIQPSRKVPESLLNSKKFGQMKASIQAVGLIEPLSISRVIKNSTSHLLLDGHIRFMALRELGHEAASCLVATDDESYTYNNHINRLSSVQEHLMIRRAVARGVSAARLAEVLSLDVRTIARKLSLLDGICPEAVELLKDRQFTPHLSVILRKMKPTRQVECVELMVSANTITVAYAEAMLVATPDRLLVTGAKPRKLSGVTPDQMLRMEREMSNLQGQYKMAEQSYGLDVLNLVLARGYLAKLLDNTSIARHLQQGHPDFVGEFKSILKTVSLE